MIPSTQLRTILDTLQSGRRNGACVSSHQVLESLLMAMVQDSAAHEIANQPKAAKPRDKE